MKNNFKQLLLVVAGTLVLGACTDETSSSVSESTSSESSVVELQKGEYDESKFAKSGYTMNDYITSTTSLDWSPLTWETSDDSAVLGYISSYLYDYELNDAKNGYTIVNELANAAPVDVTDKYVGRYGVEEGDSKKAWRISLNPDATWDNGDAITADDYVYTMQQMLDQEQLNRRADSFYSGSLAITNAKNYLYSGKVSYSLIKTTVEAAAAEGKDLYVDAWGFWGAEGYKDAEGNECPQYVSINSTVKYNDYDPTSSYYMADEFTGADLAAYFMSTGKYAAYATSYVYYSAQTPVTTWDEVGFKKVGDYAIDVILEGEMEEPTSFYLPYNFSSFVLVHKATYEASWVTNADGTKSNKYNKDVEHSRSYGPYKLSYFEDGKKLTFTRNTEWYGYKHGVTNGADAHEGQFQTTDIVWDVIENHSTAMLAFESGKLDGIGLQAEDLDKYGTSDYIVYTPQSYTTKVTFNTDLDSLKAMETTKADGKNRQIQTIKEFREAFAYCIDRQYFAGAYTSAASAGYGMINYMYQYFNADGSTSAYRDSDAAKEALLSVYGVEYGAGKTYETLDEAYEALTGYDMTKARALMNEAYTKAIAAGVYTAGQDVEIQFNVYSSDTIYVNMVNYFDQQIKEACKGTPLEGHVSFKMFVDDDYYNTMYAGNAQFIYTTWGGASYGTFGMLASCYCDDSEGGGNQMEIGYDTSKVNVTINVKGTDYTYSLQAWAYWMNLDYTKGAAEIKAALGTLNDYTAEEKCAIFAACEKTYLESYVTTPVYYRQTASLYSKKINYGTNKYVDLIGFGGIRHTTYNYTDAEWATFIADSNNLVY